MNWSNLRERVWGWSGIPFFPTIESTEVNQKASEKSTKLYRLCYKIIMHQILPSTINPPATDQKPIKSSSKESAEELRAMYAERKRQEVEELLRKNAEGDCLSKMEVARIELFLNEDP